MSSAQHSASLSNHASKQYNDQASFVYSEQYTSPVLSLLDAKPGEKIIDLGCGTGELTRVIKGLVGRTGEVWGVDSSESMLDKARRDDEGIHYEQADIQNIEKTLDSKLAGTFDAVFTSATLHWCKDDPVGVLRGINWLLKPGGRMAFEFGGFGNVDGARTALHGVLRQRGVDPLPLDPWFFPTVEQYTTMLQAHNLPPSTISLHPRPTPLTSDMFAWLETFCRNSWFAAYSREEADELMSEVQEICRPAHYWSKGVIGTGVKSKKVEGEPQWGVDEGWSLAYVRLRGLAIKQS